MQKSSHRTQGLRRTDGCRVDDVGDEVPAAIMRIVTTIGIAAEDLPSGRCEPIPNVSNRFPQCVCEDGTGSGAMNIAACPSSQNGVLLTGPPIHGSERAVQSHRRTDQGHTTIGGDAASAVGDEDCLPPKTQIADSLKQCCCKISNATEVNIDDSS